MLDKREMTGVAEDVRDIIDRRAFDEGKTINGYDMAPYSEEYARKKGRTRPNLQQTGEMRRAFDVASATKTRFRLNAGLLRQVVFTTRSRPWMAVGRDDADELAALVLAAVERTMSRSRARAR